MMEDLRDTLQMHLSFYFFSFTSAFLSLAALLLLLLRRSSWCACHVCKSYLTSSWRSQFPNLSDWYAHLLRQSPTQTVRVHVLNAVFTANPSNVEHILKTRFDNFPKGKTFSAILGDLLGRSIFNVDGPSWQFQRKLATLELGSLSVRTFAFDIVSREIHDRLLPVLSGSAGPSVDLQDLFRRFSFDTICRISFGLDPACLDLSLPISQFAGAFDAATGISARRATSVSPAVWKLKRFLNVGSERRMRRAVGLVSALAEEVIRQKRKLGFSSDGDLLSRFMGSVTDDDKYLRDIVIGFLLAGRDTVASGLTALFFLLSRHPDVLSKMREEIDGSAMAGADRDAAVGFAEMRSMSYVHAALYEGMRLYPPAQFNSKFALEDDVLPDGTFVGAGTRVTYHAYAMGRMEAVWGEDWHVFRPERWLDRAGAFVPESPFRYPVFQGGARVCLGKELAVMEMKAVAVALVREFDVEVVGEYAGQPLRFVPGLTATVSGGLSCRVSQRRRGSR